MSASDILFLRASSTSHGAENPPLFTAMWQFWQRSTVVPRLTQLVVDGVLPRLVEAQIQLAFCFLDARLVVCLHRRVVAAPLLGIAADRRGGFLQLLAKRVELPLRVRLLEPLLRPGEVGLEVSLLEREEFALVRLP